MSTLKNYKFVKSLRNKELGFDASLYKDKSGKIVFVKKLKFKNKNLLYRLLKNEALMLRVFEQLEKKVDGWKLNTPKLIELVEKKGELCLIREFVEGQHLTLYASDFKIQVMKKCLEEFKKISKNLKIEKQLNLPKRTPFHIFILFPFYFMQVLLKEPKNFLDFLKLAVIFYIQSLSTLFQKPKYLIAHRDLCSDNILVNNQKLSIIDFETTILAEEETDLALFPRFYVREISLKQILSFLKETLSTEKQKRNFVRLTIFYTFQYMVIGTKNNKFYEEAKEYIKPLLNEIIPSVRTGKEDLNDTIKNYI